MSSDEDGRLLFFSFFLFSPQEVYRQRCEAQRTVLPSGCISCEPNCTSSSSFFIFKTTTLHTENLQQDCHFHIFFYIRVGAVPRSCSIYLKTESGNAEDYEFITLQISFSASQSSNFSSCRKCHLHGGSLVLQKMIGFSCSSLSGMPTSYRSREMNTFMRK